MNDFSVMVFDGMTKNDFAVTATRYLVESFGEDDSFRTAYASLAKFAEDAVKTYDALGGEILESGEDARLDAHGEGYADGLEAKYNKL